MSSPDGAEEEQGQSFAGMGPWLEDEDNEVFQRASDLVLRQDLLAINRWNQDEYYKCVVDGYPWATLLHDTTRDVYTFELPYGVSTLSIQPVPNKNLDLVNKTSEQLLVDFPEADAQPIDDSEEAQNAADMADRFLAQDAGEQGTNDAVLFDDRTKLSLVTSTSYVEGWTDPTAGGYVPLQVEAHPQAVDVNNPTQGPDGNPTTDLILRYVTQDEQFTDDPTQAAPQWQPKIRASKWAREHIRCFPETATVDTAEKVIVLGYCTLSEAKKRWPTVAQMAPEDLSALCDWTPSRYLVLLPPFQRARWKLTDGKTKNRGGSSDERIMFYFHVYQRATPDHPKGADLVLSGVDNGLTLDKRLLSVEVDVEKGDGRVQETRCRDIPIVQITPRQDPYGQDPTGKCYLNLFVGATESNAVLAQGFAEGLNKVLHTPYASSSLSPIEGWQVEEARQTGTILSVVRPEDLPKQLDPPILPAAFGEMYEISDDAIDSIASSTKAATGQVQNNKDPSGKALQIAVQQNDIGNNSKLTAINNAYARWCRIKLELAMSYFTTSQQIAYVGEDGANKMMDLHAVDFALIGKVSIKAGTGTGLSQDSKVQYLGNLQQAGFVDPSESRDAARPSFAKRLGLPADPFEQYVSRCIDTWLDGPPETDPAPDPVTGQPKPTWAQQYTTYAQAKAMQDQVQQQVQAAQQAGAQQAAAVGQPAPMPAPPAPMAPLPPKPFDPFEDRPNDTEPGLCGVWTRKLSRIISSVDYQKWGPEWAAVLAAKYQRMRQASAMASAAQSQMPHPSAPTPPKGGAPSPQPSGPPR